MLRRFRPRTRNFCPAPEFPGETWISGKTGRARFARDFDEIFLQNSMMSRTDRTFSKSRPEKKITNVSNETIIFRTRDFEEMLLICAFLTNVSNGMRTRFARDLREILTRFQKMKDVSTKITSFRTLSFERFFQNPNF